MHPTQWCPLSKVIHWSSIVQILVTLLLCCCIPQCEESKRQLQYAIAKSRGNVALTLIIIDIVYTAAVTVLMIGLVLGLRSPYYYRY